MGDFVFRPSTRSENSITLTWKFYKKHFVHIDIEEQEKAPGAAIGNRLLISNDTFENLREIVERYIIPCNRFVREVVNHPKFSDADSWEELENRLKEEKKADNSKIPYKLAILSCYPQHVVLAYVPREKVVKEFIKVRHRGFYFHDQNHAPLQNLINWFKDNWSSREYQRRFRRQKSPKTHQKPAQLITPGGDVAMKSDQDGFGKPSDNWDVGGGSVHSQGGFDMKQEVRVCYNCNQTGHFKSECPSAKSFGRGQRQENSGGGWGAASGGASPAYSQEGRGRGRGRGGPGVSGACFKCDQPGHRAKDCPNAESNRGGGQVCFKCDKPGHMARECPNAGGGGNRGCFKCGEEGHMAKECPSGGDVGGRGRGGGGCYRCGQEGHFSRECPNEDAGGAYKRQRNNDGDSYRRDQNGEG